MRKRKRQRLAQATLRLRLKGEGKEAMGRVTHDREQGAMTTIKDNNNRGGGDNIRML